MLGRAFNVFKQTPGRPTLIIVDSHIGWGAPTKQDTHTAHGEPLGAEEIKGAKRNYGFPEDKDFYIPDGVIEHFREGPGGRSSERGPTDPGPPSRAPGRPPTRRHGRRRDRHPRR